MPKQKHPHTTLDCECGGIKSYCPPCLIRIAVTWRRAHPSSLSVGMLKRRLPELTDREAALMVELSRRF